MINQNLNLFLIFMVGIKIKTINSMKGELNLRDCPVVSEVCEALIWLFSPSLSCCFYSRSIAPWWPLKAMQVSGISGVTLLFRSSWCANLPYCLWVRPGSLLPLAPKDISCASLGLCVLTLSVQCSVLRSEGNSPNHPTILHRYCRKLSRISSI